ncbi:N-acetylglucosaminyl-phosphatidylinositol de-N-acetylase-like isoform X1 [Tachypleus tridentatus]|uniref:N-acetylglucosaminyl-phosphatidylinositol de-N-acetylase-like isoform X1 n=1 Tax=Tachypleus tridentatus TaxID=6853 RepID=UPI003FD0DEF0
MFFAPTIQQIKSTSRHPETFTDIFILCLSIGETEQLIRDFYKQGNVRKKELIQSCSILGVPLGNVFIIQHTKMPDSPHCIWRDDLVGRIILKYTNMLSADVVISFDEHGVSGHPNHISLFNGLSYLTDEDLVPVGCRFLVLKTVNKLRKYCSIFDFPLSFCEDDCVLISSPLYILRAQKAMTAHYSQLVWFRWLYILFSRYMIINSLVELKKKNKTD